MTNDIYTLMEFFSTPEKPIDWVEFMEFRNSLSNEEKIYFWTAKLT